MAKSSKWSWISDPVTVPPKHPGEKWKYPNDPEEEYRIMSRKDADSVAAARNPRPDPSDMSMTIPKGKPDVVKKSAASVADSSASKPAFGSVKKKSPAGELNGDGSIVDFLKSVGRKAGIGDSLSTFDMRKHIYETYDLGQPDEDYKGSAKQNIQLLKELKKEYTNAPDDLITELSKAVSKKKAAPEGAKDVTDEEEQDLIEQNGYEIDPIDMDDGTWDEYANKIKKKRGGPSFAEYKRGKAANLIT